MLISEIVNFILDYAGDCKDCRLLWYDAVNFGYCQHLGRACSFHLQ
jgi:hypothetical protein